VTCSICFAQVAVKRSCNAWPINDGRCCPACDDLIVTPVRIARGTKQTIQQAIAAGMAIYDVTTNRKQQTKGTNKQCKQSGQQQKDALSLSA
jgi:hypothetical protein